MLFTQNSKSLKHRPAFSLQICRKAKQCDETKKLIPFNEFAAKTVAVATNVRGENFPDFGSLFVPGYANFGL